MAADGHLGMTALSRALASAGFLVTVCIARGVDFHPDLGSGPTTSEAYRVHPIVDPT